MRIKYFLSSGKRKSRTRKQATDEAEVNGEPIDPQRD